MPAGKPSSYNAVLNVVYAQMNDEVSEDDYADGLIEGWEGVGNIDNKGSLTWAAEVLRGERDPKADKSGDVYSRYHDLAVQNAAAIIATEKASSYQESMELGGEQEDVQELENDEQENATNSYRNALELAYDIGERDVIDQILDEIHREERETGLAPPANVEDERRRGTSPGMSHEDDSDLVEMMRKSLQNSPIKEGKPRKGAVKPPAGDLRELRDALPPGVSVDTSGYRGKYSR